VGVEVIISALTIGTIMRTLIDCKVAHGFFEVSSIIVTPTSPATGASATNGRGREVSWILGGTNRAC
jgi:hypothetical protein